ncbi:MAG: type I methionyl aminopeptidase [Cyanobium sp. MAG06]|nr:type I methionyl aminopeptidase [Cyanobium sp. MAG06]
MRQIQLKTKQEDIDNLRKSGKILARVMREMGEMIKDGITTFEIDEFARKKIIELGGQPSLLGYKPYGADIPFPATVCISINEEIVHGIPSESRTIKDGDIVGLDTCVTYNGMISDHAKTFICGKTNNENEELLSVTKNALQIGIREARVGNYTSDISRAIEGAIPKKYGIVRELSGHGVGYKVHEAPYVPNYYMGNKGDLLQAGLVIAIEPMVNLGTEKIELLEDGYTIVTKDGKCSAHFEHTVLITDKGPEIITIE